ncbi:hypothetical protein [uncultured Erythrobacter sp.]|uniref:hypothetical protein n=1 Tax=uncultured Erythrobacter sp. TaxID=263913 RepID=UPI002631A5F4|nr:hypothetical protein [uncultured Erythrobacter sp.]
MLEGVSDQEHRPGTMVLLAIFLSRFEVIEIASMLRGYGIFVSMDGEHYTATIYESLAYGGYRLRVTAEDHSLASEILREADVPNRELFRTKPRPILLWFLSFWGGLHIALGVAIGAGGLSGLLGIQAVLGVPIDPKTRGDYFLSPPNV